MNFLRFIPWNLFGALMVVGSRRVLEWWEIISYSAFSLTYALVIEFDSGLIDGVEISLWSWCFLYCLILQLIRMLLWNHYWRDRRRGKEELVWNSWENSCLWDPHQKGLLNVGVGERHRRVKAPTRVSFFTWEKIYACENLIKKGYSMLSWCCMYRRRWT